MRVQELEEAGVYYKKGLARFCGDADTYDMVLRMFVDDTAMQRAREALGQQEQRAMFLALHEMKGVTGNLEMTDLYNITSTTVDLLRREQADWKLVRENFVVVEREYKRVIAALRD